MFGDGIAKHFMLPYNFKVWAHPPAMMNKEWIGERVAVVDIERVLRNVVLGPRRLRLGAEQQVQVPALRRHRRHLPSVHAVRASRSLHLRRRRGASTPTRKDGRIRRRQRRPTTTCCISTMPLDQLVGMVDGRARARSRGRGTVAVAQRQLHRRASASAARAPARSAGSTSRRTTARSIG